MRIRSQATSLVAILLLSGLGVAADPPEKGRDPKALADLIDREIDKKLKDAGIPTSAPADDAEFLRRVYLDLTGRIPSREQAVAFLDSKDADKRAKLIDELLAADNYGKHFANIWHDLIVRRDDQNRQLRTDSFRAWLAEGFNSNRGWDKTVSEMLTAEGTTAPATFTLAHRDMGRFAPSKLVGTTANLFMGVQLQCAECHKHPFIEAWKQEDFWSVAAFFSHVRATGNSVNESGAAAGRGATAVDKALTGAAIEIPDAVDPRKKTGRTVKAKFFEGDTPDLGNKAPFRPSFASWLTARENKYFAPASVNRLWAHLFARGLINPVDDMHDDNQATHPELLRQLATEFRDSGFDQKHMLRGMCASRAYQRTSKPAKANENDVDLYSHQTVKVMSPEVLYDSLTAALGVNDLDGAVMARTGIAALFRPGGGNARQQFIAFFTTGTPGEGGGELGFGIPQYLRLMNAAQFNKGGPVIDKLLQDQTPTEQAVTALFLSTLSRRPSDAELNKLSDYVARKKDPKAGYSGVLWVLLNSAEFLCIR